ncbi:Sulfatase [Rubripirellula tenax]|uniref:Sulfatase n=1 Tax=Rubripirellula tenax TaxID=2528015 RepID=A0A5C6FEU8_9BACT|nr:sulfatase-like hydrolase/transferase [Rubripirellula tenax]TWU59247.1 Sulfatase [Rubripirellula tenax]
MNNDTRHFSISAIAVSCVGCLLLAALACAAENHGDRPDRPNILWIVAEDHGPHMGCYGDNFATTPNVDKLARRGMCFDFAWSNAPVCASARTTLWSGLYGTSTGGEHMRSMVEMPANKKMFPQLLREVGYYCVGNGKEDYNFAKPDEMWDESPHRAHWNQCPDGRPFFAYFNHTESHEGKIHDIKDQSDHDRSKVRVPAYHPDHPAVRGEWARYYDSVTAVDTEAGKRLAELTKSGLNEDTIVFYFADHGAGLARNKRWPNNAGLHVPVVVYFPEKHQHLAPPEYQPGGRSDRLISFVDFAPTMLSIAGIQPPDWMQGHAFAGERPAPAQPFVHGFRGRMDERIDLVRSVFDGRYVYLRNYMPHLSQGQRVESQIRLSHSSTHAWRKLYDAGKLNATQSLFWTAPKAPEELYDLKSDPDEVHNLADSPQHQDALLKLRTAQRNHAARIRDVGFIPEQERFQLAESPYDFGHDEQRYAFTRVLETAELASMLKNEAVPQLRDRLSDADPIVRFWAAMGLVMRGDNAIAASESELLNALTDASPDVQIAAAWAIVKHGSDSVATRGLNILAEYAPRDRNNTLLSMAALTALDDCGTKAEGLRENFAKWPTSGTATDDLDDGRFNSNPWKLMKSILLRFGVKVPPANNQMRAKK